MRLAGGPYPGDPTPLEVVKGRAKVCFGSPDECIAFLESYEAMGTWRKKRKGPRSPRLQTPDTRSARFVGNPAPRIALALTRVGPRGGSIE